ncbi:uncharacterized protein LOC109537166 [Dendroctonus ponderosae]|uniref:Uncharacterized protein n=1 Tax=Dendroctonus ponderosae TaxID=77166 RepID=A0AAR5PE38_DENPD|nr:uncharacterized protein LOC109537166 [Dendroctonus ponderosae]KAH1022908.1 hypothetical protein HUJ04_012223 [Dendroctonus ponderosae]KAH1029356.1 hypothetical protein HUJ05_002614 [Dendroctonus ponderosae]
METKHVLYENDRYYQLSHSDLCKRILEHERIIRHIQRRSGDPSRTAHLRFSLDCLYFELHRRMFQNCMIQMNSVHKVKDWLRQCNPDARCDCCKPEYYEFKYDNVRIMNGTLKPSRFTTYITFADSFSDGKCFHVREIEYVEDTNAELDLSVTDAATLALTTPSSHYTTARNSEVAIEPTIINLTVEVFYQLDEM